MLPPLQESRQRVMYESKIYRDTVLAFRSPGMVAAAEWRMINAS